MNILVIGNGFDLEHGLPTRYTDFLKFTESFMDCYKKLEDPETDWVYYDTSKEVNAFLKRWFSAYYQNENGQSEEEKKNTVKIIEELKNNIVDNFWIDYFIQKPMYKKENWIDFESEISKVIQSLDDDMKQFGLDCKIQDISNIFLKVKYYKPRSELTYRRLRNILLDDLNKLIRALEIYLTEYVNKIKCSKESPDIRKIFEERDEQGKIKSFISTKILNFNYTDTFKKVYKINFDIDFIHGKADINNTIDTNNMVLGIDEYLGKKKRNEQVEFIAFKKFYQRIHKGTGCKYKEWVDTIKEEFIDYQTELEKIKTEKNIMSLKVAINKLKEQYLNKHHVYIFGHSLDVTDKDILRDLILNDNVHTVIYYHNKDAMGQQIANLVKVIGQK